MNLRYAHTYLKKGQKKIDRFIFQDGGSNIQESSVANDEEGSGVVIPQVIATIMVLIIVAAILIEHCRKKATLRRQGSLISPESRKRLAGPATRRASFTAESARRRSTIMRTQLTIEEVGAVVRVSNG